MKIKFISRKQIVDYYLDLINNGIELTEEQKELLCNLTNEND